MNEVFELEPDEDGELDVNVRRLHLIQDHEELAMFRYLHKEVAKEDKRGNKLWGADRFQDHIVEDRHGKVYYLEAFSFCTSSTGFFWEVRSFHLTHLIEKLRLTRPKLVTFPMTVKLPEVY